MELYTKAHAKLNLTLDITGKRPDGYHEISTVMQTITLADNINLSVTESKRSTVCLSCDNAADFPHITWDKSNLVYKAAKLMCDIAAKSKNHFKVTVRVQKNIPDGAGLGGGSADAAAVLLALNDMMNINLDIKTLADISVSLGADVPFLVYGGTALCEGIGEKVTVLPPAPSLTAVLIKPEFSLSTKTMYALTDSYSMISHPDVKAQVDAIMAHDAGVICHTSENYMEHAALALHPEINDYKELLLNHGADASLMTGSGSTVYGLFTDESKAKKAFDNINLPKAKKFIVSFC